MYQPTYQPIDTFSPPSLRTEPLPTMFDLPSEDPEDSGLPDEFHDFQPKLLRETCKPPDISPDRYFIGADLNLYYDTQHTRWYKRPDWFLVLGVAPVTQQSDLRLSYVTWQEGRNPFLVIELLSPGTEAEDLGQTLRDVDRPPTKWQVYEQMLRVPYYALFDRYTLEFRLFKLVATRYEEIQLTDRRHWFDELNLGLGVYPSVYNGVEGMWLRWTDETGQLVLNDRESLFQERNRTDRLAAKLRALGIDPESDLE